jgi:hypothetical protein
VPASSGILAPEGLDQRIRLRGRPRYSSAADRSRHGHRRQRSAALQQCGRPKSTWPSASAGTAITKAHSGRWTRSARQNARAAISWSSWWSCSRAARHAQPQFGAGDAAGEEVVPVWRGRVPAAWSVRRRVARCCTAVGAVCRRGSTSAGAVCELLHSLVRLPARNPRASPPSPVLIDWASVTAADGSGSRPALIRAWRRSWPWTRSQVPSRRHLSPLRSSRA